MFDSIKKLLRNNNLKILLVFTLFLAFFNIAFIDSGGWARLAWNFLGYLGLLITYRVARLRPGDVGLSKKYLKNGLRYAAAVVLVLFIIFVLVFIFDKNSFKDPRYHHDLSAALFASIVLLPLKTVLFEEIAFRGIIPALILRIKNSQHYAIVISSLMFGLWHVVSATKIDANNIVGGVSAPSFLVVVGVFLITSVAGAFFYELRRRSNSLLAPIIVHWFINGSAIILASLSWR